ncbi:MULTISPECIES: DNA-methyltransferase [Streptomyces]|uniref:DNA-methyltransferase n=1 Tax=Streptomyces TaxID=1883 RepID=UPI002248D5B9|nr:site-specific DNA-methyltransferase [Streptomyces sp. JHD 1]MCX2969545.1 site-specific DNA-methyltransferase [Streptomyces sp. JHD 1]
MNVVPSVNSVADIQDLLTELTGLDGTFDSTVRLTLGELISEIGPPDRVDMEKVESQFYGRLNQKLSLNQFALGTLYSVAARAGVTFNYPTKKSISWAVDSMNKESLESILAAHWPGYASYPVSLDELDPCDPRQTKQALQREAVNPSKLRKAHGRQVLNDVFNAATGPLVWSLWEPKILHRHFQEQPGGMPYSGEYLQDLQHQSPDLFNRDYALTVAFVGSEYASTGYTDLRSKLTHWLSSEYGKLNNYGFISVIIDTEAIAEAWQLACDLVLYGEHFIEARLQNRFFRWREVMQETRRHIPYVDAQKAGFEIANEGYTYRDQFVLTDPHGQQKRLVLLMQKNQRDETPIPCPACRSSNISGNSYPILGVKSWECSNVLCPERSIYNRGKRYSFKALLSQEAIEHPSNEIPVESVRRWQKDILPFESDGEILDMCVRHYSMVGDSVTFHEVPKEALSEVSAVGREQNYRRHIGSSNEQEAFWNSALFQRFQSAPVSKEPGQESQLSLEDHPWQILAGDSLHVLARIGEATFDRAITSPPYFNAREYSQWPNLYCYLHDMQAIAREVFRVLKPGAVYAYNIFDTFDNERIVTFSDMGKKRISLSAWTADIFRRVGFELRGNLVWDKGEIHGKRGFNAENFSPFYQSPFNCWEHVLIFQKPGPGSEDSVLLDNARKVARIHPIVKMVRGENRHGHTAPFPQALPERLLDGLPAGSLVLDPFGGSGTTARAALSAGMRSVMIEQDPSYVSLSRKLTEEHEQSLAMSQETLFSP